MQADSFKLIAAFLQSNNLTDTLATLTKEVEKNEKGRKGERNRQLLHSMGKARFNLNDEWEVKHIRDTLQMADENALCRLVTRLHFKVTNVTMPNKTQQNLQQMDFYRKLLEKEKALLKARAIKKSERNPNEISEIEVSQCNNDSIISRPEEAILILEEGVDEYEDDQDIGYKFYDASVSQFQVMAEEIAKQRDYPRRAIRPNTSQYPEEYFKNKSSNQRKKQLSHVVKLPEHLKFPEFNDDFYPVQFDGTVYDTYHLKVVYDQNKVGFEQSRELDLTEGKLIAGRYRVIQVMGQGQFSKVVSVEDSLTGQEYCMKVISNNKDYVDQSLDQIKLLLYINANAHNEVDSKCVLRCHDFFYYKEHLIILTQLLKTDLYKCYMEQTSPPYFTLQCVQRVAQQILIAMEYIHSLNIIHSDLKPENILIKSFSQQLVKVIDFGNSAFFHDTLTFYIQTRGYRAPEVILGCPYDEKIDIWSVGCIVAELFTGRMMFENESVPALLAKQQGVVGPWPQWMLESGKNFEKFFTKNLVIYEAINSDKDQEKIKFMRVYEPKKSNIKARLGTNDPYFVDFVKSLLELDPTKRPTAKEALRHPFLTEARYQS